MAAKVDENVVVMIIGSMPGEVSLAKQEYYGHPKTCFGNLLRKCFQILTLIAHIPHACKG